MKDAVRRNMGEEVEVRMRMDEGLKKREWGHEHEGKG